mgnify:CR=1 FL=1
MEQDLKIRVLKDRLEHVYEHEKESVINLFLALQRQNFVLGNSLTNLIDKWPTVPPTTNEVPAMFGILLENKD